MTRVCLALALGILSLTALRGSTAAQDADGDRPTRGRDRDRGAQDQDTIDMHAASIESTRLAAESLGRAVEIEAARRVAPFDLDWGTP